MKMIPPIFLIHLDPVFDAVPTELFNRVNDVFGIHQDPLFTVREDIRKDQYADGFSKHGELGFESQAA